ncbi:MAG: PAS domain S-box protein [Deltaproteobacteria bacterium]|nr:PAS domain S-box protein [Deltaproteobacteria bacterium]
MLPTTTTTHADAHGEGAQLVPGGMMWEADPWAVHLTFVRNSGSNLLGYPDGKQTEQGFLGRHVHPDDWGRLLATLYDAAVDGAVHRCAHRLYRADRSLFWAQTTVQRSRSNGTLTLAGLTVDITEALEPELRGHEADHTAKLLIDNVRDYALFMISTAGAVMSWNVGAHRLKQYSAAEIIGEPFTRFFPDDEHARARALLQSAELDGRAEYDGWLVRKNGERFWGNVILCAITHADGGLYAFAHIARDLTRHKKQEAELVESEEHFRLLVRSVSDYAVFVLSPGGIVESWNQGSQRLNGYRAAEAIGSHLSRFFPPEAREKRTPERLIDDAVAAGTATWEGWLERKGGKHFWGMVTLGAIEDEHGRLRGLSHVARDLTERKATEDALHASEERLRLLIDSLTDSGIFMLSCEGNVMSWSPGAEQIKGYKTSEVIGLPLASFFPEDELKRDTPKLLLQRVLGDGRTEYEGWMVRKDGSQFWANVTFDAITDARGEVVGITNVVRDLSARKRAERAQSILVEVGGALGGTLDCLEALRNVVKTVTRGFAQWCVINKVADQANEIVLAHADPQAEADLLGALHAVTDQDRHGGVVGCLHNGRSVRNNTQSEFVIRSLGITDPQFEQRFGNRSYICVPLQARDKTVGAMAFVAEEGKSYTNDDLLLSEEVARRTALGIDNAKLYSDAQDAVRVREEVLAVVTHDLRNPLTTIQMAGLRLAAVEGVPSDPELIRQLGAKVVRSAERMNHLISDLLDISSIQASRFSIKLEAHPVRPMVAEAVEMMQPIATDKGLELKVEIEPTDITIRCDRDRIVQVFSNLIGNAIKYTTEGWVLVRSAVERDRIVFTIKDSGPGIPSENIEKIFDRYWQAKNGRGGMGLGLSISKVIVEAHGGSIWVESRLGHGSTFSFSLPI